MFLTRTSLHTIHHVCKKMLQRWGGGGMGDFHFEFLQTKQNQQNATNEVTSGFSGF